MAPTQILGLSCPNPPAIRHGFLRFLARWEITVSSGGRVNGTGTWFLYGVRAGTACGSAMCVANHRGSAFAGAATTNHGNGNTQIEANCFQKIYLACHRMDSSLRRERAQYPMFDRKRAVLENGAPKNNLWRCVQHLEQLSNREPLA